MRRAVLLTGALRTIRKTMRFFKRNVLCARDDEVAVFACVQNDTKESDAWWTEWLSGEIGDGLVDVSWFSLEAFPHWVAQRERCLGHLPQIDEGWKGYLRNSGSMIEYAQLQYAYLKMCATEGAGGFSYDYVIRARTDSIYVKPVDFHWLDWTEETIVRRWEAVQREMHVAGIKGSEADVFRYFMCTVWSDDVLPNLGFLTAEHVPSALGGTTGPSSYEPVAIRDYLRRGRYILTLRKNNLYVVRRDLFHFLPTLGSLYGFLRSPRADAWWFNAEGQFRDACYYSCVDVYEYSSDFEERSLVYPHQWREEDFFDGHGEVIQGRMLYCVVRR